MRIPFNKVGNIEIEHNTLKYRLPLLEVSTDDISVLEKNLKRKASSIEHEPYYLIPFELQIINNSIIYYYNMIQYKSYDYLRQIPFQEKLTYYLSLIEIAKKMDQTKVVWDRHNFVIDLHEEKIKAIIYETEDIKIHEEKDSFEGVRELILISLTTLNQIVSKPRRVDFIDQSDHIIQFAETLLSGKIESIEDLRFFIETKQIEMDYDNDEVLELPEEKKKKTIKVNFPLKRNKPRSPVQSYKKSSGKKGSKSANKLIVVLGVVLVIALILNFAMPKHPDTSKAKEPKTIHVKDKKNMQDKATSKNDNIEKTSNKYNEMLLKAYRLSVMGKQDEALKEMESIGYDKLGTEDKEFLLNLYQKDNQIYKILDLDPSKGKDIVNNLIANNKGNELLEIQKKMKTHNPYVDFEVAYLKQDWKEILKLKDQVEINGRKEHQITEAYLNLNQKDNAEKYAENVGDPELIQMVKDFSVTD